ncbi:glutamine amidotransferase subunit PdxT [Listeria newyorkensis]|uniref:Pyridoxal 5'-phosphate synthase subunit PdxT n=1 Tax=Listeria newyorkensis TaxID=1497681 RepID=A0ABX4XR46_9LIST|nr:pyridoxal 5'-phosphate synthase glutaminase subunit PdxT [Listeria newyorkensis]KGL43984.1 glutamine amidotransferase [Listeria newyorkensis]PNP94886.1 glutamine amidotransferase subunit PdxT [Listeria newyorkensis]WAO21835.1 pyridoxal 5'-phosphate synthase glutaminase subunit PdxT [Listeria newyorkensis]SQC59951.1 Glutamine amidotransferase subunit pdxT [Listeria newyorkensis]
MKKIGVLALQGAVSEHLDAISRTGATAVAVKHPDQLQDLDGLILPGGESTTMRRLMKKYDLFETIQAFAKAGKGVFGTCAGLVLTAREIDGSNDETLGLIDTVVMRNGFGRQKDSFEVAIAIKGLEGEPFPTVFIRAPYIASVGEQVEVLATVDDTCVAARHGKILVTAFHPELTGDTRLLELFIASL